MTLISTAFLVGVLASSVAAQQCSRMVILRVPDILGSGETYEASIVTADATSTVFTLACPQASVCEYSTRTNTFTDMPATESYAFNFRETLTRSSDDQTSTVLYTATATCDFPSAASVVTCDVTSTFFVTSGGEVRTESGIVTSAAAPASAQAVQVTAGCEHLDHTITTSSSASSTSTSSSSSLSSATSASITSSLSSVTSASSSSSLSSAASSSSSSSLSSVSSASASSKLETESSTSEPPCTTSRLETESSTSEPCTTSDLPDHPTTTTPCPTDSDYPTTLTKTKSLTKTYPCPSSSGSPCYGSDDQQDYPSKLGYPTESHKPEKPGSPERPTYGRNGTITTSAPSETPTYGPSSVVTAGMSRISQPSLWVGVAAVVGGAMMI